MTDTSKDPRDLAIHWTLRQRAGDMDEAEWDAFTEWLEESSEHAALLDELQAADEGLEALGDVLGESEPASPVADNENDAAPDAANDNQFKHLLPIAGLVAAAVAIFALWPSGAPDPITITTQPGETRIVAVSDEITMTLNGGTQVTLIEEDAYVTIARGEVVFDIASEEPSPLRVEVDDLVLVDYGTVFNVIYNNGGVNIAVAEGAVGINPDAENVQVEAGQQVTRVDADAALVRASVDTETVGTWQEGRLEFDNTPAPEAVAMLERSTGSQIVLSDALSRETLTGSLILSDDEQETMAQFAAFLGARARRGRLATVRSGPQEGTGTVWNIR